LGQISLMSGPERRRHFTDEQKEAILAAAFAPGSSVAAVARQADIGTGLIYRWRDIFQSKAAKPSFARAVLVDDPGPPVSPTPGPVAAAILVEIGGARVQIGASATPALITATLRALQS
jgi:transposase